MKNSLAWLILWLPLAGFLFNAISGLIIKDLKLQKRVVSIIAPLVIFAAFVVSCLVLVGDVWPAPEHRVFASLIPGLSPDTVWMSMAGFNVTFGLLLDPLSMLMAMIVTGVGCLIHIYATGYMADDREQPRFFTYFNLFIFMMLMLVLGDSFLLMFVGWEGVGSCSYLLISFWYTDTNNAKAGNKAFIVNRVGDFGFTLGMLAIWSIFGTLQFFNSSGTGVMQLAQLGHTADPSVALSAVMIGSFSAITVICVLLFIGSMGKSAQIPLWVWLPDAMAGPTPVSALIHAATMVTGGVVMLSRCSWLFMQSVPALQLVAWVGLITAFIGATVGLVQTDIKRVLAFSTVSQLGYMFLACGVGQFWMGMFHVTTHAFFKALLFLGSGAVIHSMHGEQDMRKMGGLAKLIPATHLLMLIGTVAIAGVPPLSGFWSKDEILHAASASPWGSGAILYGVGLFVALMTSFYMCRMMWKTFYVKAQFENGKLAEHHHSNFDDEEHGHGDAHGHTEGRGSVHSAPPSMIWPLWILAILSIGFGLVVGPNKMFEHFLESSIAPLSLGHLEEAHALFDVNMGYVISTVVALLGIGLAYLIYNGHRLTGSWIPEDVKERWLRRPTSPQALVFDLFANKWGFDWAYNLIFIRGGGWFAENILWKTVDKGLIDGFVNGFASLVGGISGIGRKSESGYVRNYALVMLIGVVCLVTFVLATWNRINSYQ